MVCEVVVCDGQWEWGFMSVEIEDTGRVRVITLDRPKARNAFDEEHYDLVTEALIEADTDPGVAVIVFTGSGTSFCAGTDVLEMASRVSDPANFKAGKHGFPGLINQLTEFRKPFICAVNGLGVGIGATILGFADLALMSTAARLRFPFTRLGVAPEAASSVLFPTLIGRQAATWALLSSEWIPAEEALELGIVWKVCEPEELMAETMRRAQVLATKPISSLVASKELIAGPMKAAIVAARGREDAAFQVLLGGPANIEAMTAFAEKREPNFTT
jgi:enoyl-CoA hydratase/carnithine racemase